LGYSRPGTCQLGEKVLEGKKACWGEEGHGKRCRKEREGGAQKTMEGEGFSGHPAGGKGKRHQTLQGGADEGQFARPRGGSPRKDLLARSRKGREKGRSLRKTGIQPPIKQSQGKTGGILFRQKPGHPTLKRGGLKFSTSPSGDIRGKKKQGKEDTICLGNIKKGDDGCRHEGSTFKKRTRGH